MDAPLIEDFTHGLDWRALREEADALLRRLFPICRSITGPGVRETLSILREIAPFQVHEVPSGTVCYDWTVPDEWVIRDAYVATLDGARLIDFRKSNLHIVNYSEPIDAVMTFEELVPHLHALPDLPRAIPYRTTYYKRDWGFCLTYEQLQAMDRAGTYRVVIDSSLAPGALTYGEALIPGLSGSEYLVSTYCCHPSMANDNLSGVVLWALLLRELSSRPRRHSYRFVVVPETIGALAYLARNEESMKHVRGGFVITTVAGPGAFGFKSSYRGDAGVDRVVDCTFAELGLEPLRYPFDINGSDERQYSAPAFRIPVTTITKDKYYEYDFYHTSLDNLDFINSENLIETLKLYLLAIEKLELDLTYRSLNPHGEPMLGKRGLYPQTGGSIQQSAVSRRHAERRYQIAESAAALGSELDAIRWLMFLSDGATSLLRIAEKTGLPMRQLYEAAERLRAHGLLERIEGEAEADR
jgi:aminopeptidase-like protein